METIIILTAINLAVLATVIYMKVTDKKQNLSY